MKKQIILLILIFVGTVFSGTAQKFGYIDTEFITSKMPDYEKAQLDIEALTDKWIKEIAAKNEEVDKLERTYRAEEVLLTEEMKQQRQRVIADKQKDVRALQNKVFGINGDLIKKKQELMKPILDEIAKAVEKVARQKRLDFLFDKSSDGLAMLYTNPIHDYTDYIMEELGISTEQLKEKEREKQVKEGEEQGETSDSKNSAKPKSKK